MALALASPCGVLSDDDEWLAVLESTAADQGGLMPRHHPEISVIKPAVVAQAPAGPAVLPKAELDRGGSGDEGVDKLKVYLRVRPLTEAEKERGEEQGCVAVQTEEILLLKAPKHSHNMKSAERGVAQSMHKFSFTKILGPQTKQQDVYDQTMREMVRDVLRGENRLLYTYGVTNSGKTYTVQGAGGEAGLLPRALVSVFLKLSGRLYPAMDLKPVLSQEIRRLDAGEVRAEEIRRDALLKEEEAGSSKRPRGGPSTSWDSGIGGLSATSHIATQLEDTDGVGLEAEGLSLSGGEELVEGTQFSVWVSFYEIYNEFLYDLLEAPPSLQQRKRATLRLSDDKHGNTYVKDLTWIQVRSAEEAWRVLKAGQRNQSFASTHLNHNSSRSHSIFTIRVLHIKPEECQGQGQHISELSVCDLAGSERCKDQNGERRKEANNINTSLLTLGRCINALRFNQTNRARPAQVVPFRDSKLTRVLQGFFCGRGRSCMVVNINPCASTYDETLQALKFSAIATQLVHGPSTKTRVAYILSLLREQQAHENDSTLLEDEEEEEDGDDEGDITMFDPEELLKAIEVLKREVLRQRQEKEANESAVREQVWTEMMEVVNSMQDDFSEALENDRALMEERCENRIKNLKSSLKKYYIQEIEERDEEIGRLNAALAEREVGEVTPAPIFPPLGETEGPRRSRRIASSHGHESKQPHAETELLKVQLEQCQTELDLKHAELQLKTLELKRLQDQQTVSATPNTMTSTAERKLEEGQRNVRQLRADLQRLGLELQSGERACCRNTDGEKLRHALSAADSTLAKQDQMLVELYTSLQLVKADLRKKTESLALLHTSRALPPPSTPIGVNLGGSCKKRGCGAENQPPEKRPFLRSLFGSRTPGSQTRRRPDPVTPYASVLRTRQPSPQPSPMLERRGRAKY